MKRFMRSSSKNSSSGSKSMGSSLRSATSTGTSVSGYSTTTSSISLTPQKINELAQALQMSVEVTNRKCQNTRKRFKQVFLGNEAVDILQQLADVPTRQDALQVGRLLQTTLGLFDCVNTPRVCRLEDDDRLFYQFVKTTTAPKKKLVIKNLEEKMKIFQRRVVVKDREYYVTTYKQCFVGKEAVDLMMAHRMGKTRAECVEIGRIFQNRYNMFVPATSTGFTLDFEDDPNRFYRLLVPQREQEKKLTFIQELKPARWIIVSSLIPALIAYYYFY